MKKHILITKIFDSGGSNTHFKTMVKYLGAENLILILERNDQLDHLKNIFGKTLHKTIVLQELHGHAHLAYKFISNVKELFYIIKSLITIMFLHIIHNCNHITISAVEPEKHLYLFWLPFVKVTYILHTEPSLAMTKFTTKTCNYRLCKRRQIITVSNAMKEVIRNKWNITQEKEKYIKVIYNCVVNICSDKDSMYIKEARTHTVITLGHVDERKNPNMWFEVAKVVTAKRPNVEFIWLGNGSRLNYFKEAAVNSEKISFLGLVQNCQTFLEKSTLYYQPSLEEPQGIAVLEAMYNCLPCVVSNIGGLPESVKHNYNGFLVSPLDFEENVSAILKLLDNESLRNSYGLNSYKRYEKLFTYKSFKSKMNEVYND